MRYGIRNGYIYCICMATIYYTNDTYLINNNYNDTISFKKTINEKTNNNQ